MQSTNGVATCLEEDGIIEWKRALIYVRDAETYPTGILFNNKKIDVLYNKINLIKGNDNVDEMKKGTPYEVERVSKKFLLIAYVLYSM